MTDLASELIIEVYEIQKTAQSKITGKTVVFTGTLSAMGRAEAKALAEKLGARVSSSISQKTDYLVVGDAAGSKAKKSGTVRGVHTFGARMDGNAGRGNALANVLIDKS